MATKRYILSVDLDDTIAYKGRLSFFTRLGLKTILQAKNYVILNTGRHLQDTISFIKSLNLYNYYFICNDGASIYQINHKNKITKNISVYIDNSYAEDFLNSLKDCLSYAVIRSDYDLYYFHKEAVPDYLIRNVSPETVHEIDSFDIDAKIVMINYGIKEDKVSQYEKIIHKGKFENSNITSWGEEASKFHFDLLANDVDKGNAILKLAKILKVSEDHIIALGDGLNDFPLLKKVKTAILVSNKDNQDFPLRIKQSKNSVISYLFKNFKNLFF